MWAVVARRRTAPPSWFLCGCRTLSWLSRPCFSSLGIDPISRRRTSSTSRGQPVMKNKRKIMRKLEDITGMWYCLLAHVNADGTGQTAMKKEQSSTKNMKVIWYNISKPWKRERKRERERERERWGKVFRDRWDSYPLRGMKIADRREADIVERMVGHLIFPQIWPTILKRPEGQGIALLAFPDRQIGTKTAHVATTAVDPAVIVEVFQRTLEWLNLRRKQQQQKVSTHCLTHTHTHTHCMIRQRVKMDAVNVCCVNVLHCCSS